MSLPPKHLDPTRTEPNPWIAAQGQRPTQCASNTNVCTRTITRTTTTTATQLCPAFTDQRAWCTTFLQAASNTGLSAGVEGTTGCTLNGALRPERQSAAVSPNLHLAPSHPVAPMRGGGVLEIHHVPASIEHILFTIHHAWHKMMHSSPCLPPLLLLLNTVQRPLVLELAACCTTTLVL